ncbi:MAG: hypothetical protein LUG55_09780 [Clostridiales bacterium]|nr:hypothetical protein [Clostridiales bacterium]
MNQLIGTGGYANAKVDSIGLPATIECDGPAAISNNYTGESGTAFNCATMIAATWSKDLAYQRGQMMGQQCNDMNVVGWYGPAMNIHRTAFSGRNFEYYSEDGVLSGWMGASEVAGAKEYGIQCYIKHFALNDSEINRSSMLCTWCNEQAMREIYLKSFEMSVKIGGADNVMTAFNYIGNVWAGACEELLQTVLRDEWGFVGSTVSDWFHGTDDGYMLADSAIRVGATRCCPLPATPRHLFPTQAMPTPLLPCGTPLTTSSIAWQTPAPWMNGTSPPPAGSPPSMQSMPSLACCWWLGKPTSSSAS